MTQTMQNEDFLPLLREVRKLSGVTHQRAAEYLGLNHRASYGYIERGKQKITKEQAMGLMEFFGSALKSKRTVKRSNVGNTYQLVRTQNRTPYDFYPTPRSATVALLEYLDLFHEVAIWEPASGEGHISKVLEEYGYHVVSSDIRQEVYGKGDQNFFLCEQAPCPIQITNPPYQYAERWIRHSHSLGLERFALLLKSNFFHTQKGERLYAEFPPSLVLPVSWTLNFKTEKGRETQMDFTWFVWEDGNLETKYHVLRKPEEA